MSPILYEVCVNCIFFCIPPLCHPHEHDHWELYLLKGKSDRKLKEGIYSVYLAGIKTLRQSETLALPVEDFGGIGPGVSNS